MFTKEKGFLGIKGKIGKLSSFTMTYMRCERKEK
jgi:hypothetical protein